MSLTLTHRRYLLLDQGVGSFVINVILNAVIAWLMFGDMEACTSSAEVSKVGPMYKRHSLPSLCG